MESSQTTYCMICLELKVSITTTACCSKIICKQCSEGIKNSGNRCPNCRTNDLKTESCIYLTKAITGSNPANGPTFQTNCLQCRNLALQALVFSCCGSLICQGCKHSQEGKKCRNCEATTYLLKIEPFTRKFLRQISKDIQIMVKTMAGTTILVRLKELDKSSMLFKRVVEQESIPLAETRLTFNGKQLQQNQLSLRTYGLQENSTVHLLFRLKGGYQR